MKKLFYGVIAIVLFVNFSFCQEKKETKDEYLKVNELINKVTELGDSKNNIVTFDIGYNKEKDLYVLSNLIVQNDEFVNEFMKSYNEKSYFEMKGKVTITCVMPDGNAVQTSCNKRDGGCIEKAVSECINAGGYANVCSSKGIYVPEGIKQIKKENNLEDTDFNQKPEFKSATIITTFNKEVTEYKYKTLEEFKEGSDELIKGFDFNSPENRKFADKCEVTITVKVEVSVGVATVSMSGSVTTSCANAIAAAKKLKSMLIYAATHS